jgi:tetratricopeptide (TPR) repeat protein
MDRLLSHIGIDYNVVPFETSFKPDNEGISTSLKTKSIVPDGYKPSLQQAINLFEKNTHDDLVGLDPDLLVKLGIAHRELGEHRQAIRYFKAAIEIEPSFNSNFQLSHEYWLVKEYMESEKIINKLLDDNMENAHLWKVLGINMSSQGRMEDAENAFQKAMNLQPDYFDMASTFNEL